MGRTLSVAGAAVGVMAVLCAGCIIVGADAQPPAAGKPSVQQLLDAAREAATDAQSRELLVRVAVAAREHQSDAALSDFLAALELPVPGEWDPEERWTCDAPLAEGLVALGEPARAQALLEGLIDAVMQAEPAPEEPLSGPPQGIWERPYGPLDAHYLMQVTVLSEIAQLLFPLNHERVAEVADSIRALIGRMTSPTAVTLAEPLYVRVLALVRPAEALAMASDEQPNPFDARAAMNAVWSDYTVLLPRVDQIAQFPAAEGLDSDDVYFALYAAAMRDDPAAAVELMQDVDMLHRVPDTYEAMLPLARAVRDADVTLPEERAWQHLRQRLPSALALEDVPAALQMALALTEPTTRAAALGEMVEVLAPRDLSAAREVARALLAGEGSEGRHGFDLRRAALALSEADTEVVGELLRGIDHGDNFSAAYGAWWASFRQEAEALLPQLSEDQRLFAWTGILERSEAILNSEERRELARRALGSPGFGREELPTMRLLTAIATFAPDFARQGWQALAPLSGDVDAEIIQERLKMLLEVARGFEGAGPGSAGPEIAQVQRLLALVSEEEWVPVYRAELADILGHHDPDAAKTTAEEVLASLAGAPEDVRGLATAIALGALARVDPAAARAAFIDADLSPTDADYTSALGAIAVRRPVLALELIFDLAEERRREFALEVVGAEVAREARVEDFAGFHTAWIGRVKDVRPVLDSAIAVALESMRPEVIDALPQLYGDASPRDVALAIEGMYEGDLALATDVLLADLAGRLAALPDEGGRVAARRVAAAIAERDLARAQTWVVPLPSVERGETLLLAVTMRETAQRWAKHSRRLTGARQTFFE